MEKSKIKREKNVKNFKKRGRKRMPGLTALFRAEFRDKLRCHIATHSRQRGNDTEAHHEQNLQSDLEQSAKLLRSGE